MQLSAGDRRAVIEDLLDIQIFSSMNAVVKSKLTSTKDEAAKLKIQIDGIKEKIELHKKHLEVTTEVEVEVATTVAAGVEMGVEVELELEVEVEVGV